MFTCMPMPIICIPYSQLHRNERKATRSYQFKATKHTKFLIYTTIQNHKVYHLSLFLTFLSALLYYLKLC